MPRLKTPGLAFALALLSLQPALRAADSLPVETKAQHDARLAWWREARFGMFIHWGIYSVPAGTWQGQPVPGIGEWIMNKGKIPVADYEAFAPRFNPVQFDAEAWVALAKAAGMKYIVITAKHHDGFAMYRSAVDRYNIYDATPFHRDPLQELAAACLRQGLKLGFYYSQSQDWHAPGASAIGGHWDPKQDGDMDAYLRTKSVPQVRELLTNYQPFPAVLWFDTPTELMTKERAELFLPLLREHPNVIWNNRLGGGYHGDTETPEQHIPPKGIPGRDWETCMTINDTWGFKSYDHNFKSTETLLRNLIDIASKGGNYLLNVGPTAEGVIPAPEAERLRQMGAWLAVNGEAIYGSGPTLFGDEDGAFSPTEKDAKGQPKFIPEWKWRCTTKPGRIYLHLFAWPDGPFELHGTHFRVARAYLLADPQRTPLRVVQQGGDLTVTLPRLAPDAMASVVCLETD
ncbi:MAG TPA: alpha-L-fucosidase [Opitutaceae bacterium]|jgi:alpha-L-fucosidase|nr:alpha-L-fucosidase [Opitutaceae bacterium]